MAIVTTDNQYYTAIANAIRGKNGTETTYKPSDMAAAITALPTGGGGSTGWDNIVTLVNPYPTPIDSVELSFTPDKLQGLITVGGIAAPTTTSSYKQYRNLFWFKDMFWDIQEDDNYWYIPFFTSGPYRSASGMDLDEHGFSFIAPSGEGRGLQWTNFPMYYWFGRIEKATNRLTVRHHQKDATGTEVFTSMSDITLSTNSLITVVQGYGKLMAFIKE